MVIGCGRQVAMTLCVCVSRQSIPASSSDERGYRDVGQAASKCHSHCQQLRNLQSQCTQPNTQLWVRHAHSHCSQTDEHAGETLSVYMCLIAVSKTSLSTLASFLEPCSLCFLAKYKACDAFSASRLTTLLCLFICPSCITSFVCLFVSVWLF